MMAVTVIAAAALVAAVAVTVAVKIDNGSGSGSSSGRGSGFVNIGWKNLLFQFRIQRYFTKQIPIQTFSSFYLLDV